MQQCPTGEGARTEPSPSSSKFSEDTPLSSSNGSHGCVMEPSSPCKSLETTLSSSDSENGTDPSEYDRYGFETRTPSGRIPKAVIAEENKRISKWLRMTKKWLHYERTKSHKIRQRAAKGVPEALRGEAWQMMTDSRSMLSVNAGMYRTIVNGMSTAQDAEIKRDLKRTFPHHVLFKKADGQQKLYNVLKAFAAFDKEVGYCQGMGFIAAGLLMYMVEEEAFWLLVRLIQSYNLGGLYLPGMPLLNRFFYVLDHLILQHLPKLHAHLAAEDFTVPLFAAQWFITLFAYNLPFETTLRVWDVFFSEKGSWKFIFRVALSILSKIQSQVVALQQEGLIEFFRELPPSLTHSSNFIKDAMKFPLKRSVLVGLEEQYRLEHPGTFSSPSSFPSIKASGPASTAHHS